MDRGYIKQIVTDAIRYALEEDVDWEEALFLAFGEPNHEGPKVAVDVFRMADKAYLSAGERWQLDLTIKRKAALLVLADLYARIPDPATGANR